jgi:DNA polymerase-3 subunit delta
MVAQARHWGARNLEDILAAITEADLTLRSSSPAPAQAVIERLMMRIAMKHHR